MELIENYPVGSAVIIVLLFLSLILTAILSIRRTDKEVAIRNKEAAERAVEKILDQIGWESKQRWVTDNEIEFVSVINGHTPGQYKTWARVRVSKNSLAVTIEYWWDLDHVHLDWARFVAQHFRKRNIPATVRAADRQPASEEIYIPEPPVENEWDSPNPPFSRY